MLEILSLVVSLVVFAFLLRMVIVYNRRFDATIERYKAFVERCEKLQTEYQHISLKSLSFRSVRGMTYIRIPSSDKATTFPDGIFSVYIYHAFSDSLLIDSTMQQLHQVSIAFGFEVIEVSPPVYGSWFQKFRWKAQTSDAVVERLEKLERAIEMQGLILPQSQADKNHLEGAAALLNALSNDECISLIGSLLIVKLRTGSNSFLTITKTLSQKQLIFLEKHPKLLQSPKDILDAIENGDSQNGSGEIIHRT